MPFIVHCILSVGMVRPYLVSQKLMLWQCRVVKMALGITAVFALHFLQKHNIGVKFTQAITQFVHYHAPIEMGEALVNVVCDDFERSHNWSGVGIILVVRECFIQLPYYLTLGILR